MPDVQRITHKNKKILTLKSMFKQENYMMLLPTYGCLFEELTYE